MSSMTNKNVLVTGGTSGIGYAIARALVDLGASVVITGRRDTGESTAAEIGARFVRCDVTDETQVVGAYEDAAAGIDGLDVVILNAGIARDTEGLANTDSSVMHDIMATNVMGVYYGLKHAPRHMNDRGSIIISGSAAGSGTTMFGYGEYSASKAAAAWLGRTAAIEFADRGIRVNTVCPASIAGTGMMAEDDGSPESRLNGSFTALDRMGSQDEAVALYTFLAGDESSFITGQEICVDGGATAGFSAHVTEALVQRAGLSGEDSG